MGMTGTWYKTVKSDNH